MPSERENDPKLKQNTRRKPRSRSTISEKPHETVE